MNSTVARTARDGDPLALSTANDAGARPLPAMLDSMRAPLNTMQLKLDNAAVTTTKLTMPAACRSPSDSNVVTNGLPCSPARATGTAP